MSAKVIRQFGGSELSLISGGSLTIESGGKANVAGVVAYSDGASVSHAAGVKIDFGNTQILYGTAIPTISASPGSLYFRTEGSASLLYINTSDGGAAGSAWSSACINRP